ncbi:hypothetical protein HPB50_007861 [Hyalomma asiaticum]|uniref:Uncharacterized protein n=1 Tax=Hyalomma asiaticum TaxID=266040 RepID=A0ACB7T8V5_HYAAI|nr:hypothetical protein HPB50_007861 [Hyalomma asiaticum]
MIRGVSAGAPSTDARSFAADDRRRRLDDRERAVETRRRELLTATMAHTYCCAKSCDASARSGEPSAPFRQTTGIYALPMFTSQEAAMAGAATVAKKKTKKRLRWLYEHPTPLTESGDLLPCAGRVVFPPVPRTF